MNYCQFRNDVIKRMAVTSSLLPAQYRQVEYLKSNSDGAYIDTLIPATQIKGFVTKIQIDYTVSGYMAGFGCNSASKGNLYFCTPGSNVARMAINSSNTDMTTGAVHTIEYLSNRLTIDGVYKTTVTFSAGDATNLILFLFGTKAASQQTTTYIYSFDVYNASGMTRQFIPCYRKSDNKPGMYDLVTNAFFTNAGTGEFTVGQDV